MVGTMKPRETLAESSILPSGTVDAIEDVAAVEGVAAVEDVASVKGVASVEGVASAEGVVTSVEVLVRDHYQRLYRYAFRLCGNQPDAEDLVQQTFLVAQARLSQLRDPDQADRWLFAILRNGFFKSVRRVRPVAAAAVQVDVEAIPDERISALQRAEDTLDQEVLQDALNELPAEFRLVVVMFYLEELSYQEIADRLDLPIGTVMSRLSRAKGRLRDRLFPRPRWDGSDEKGMRSSPTK